MYHTSEFEATLILLPNLTSISIDIINATVSTAVAKSTSARFDCNSYVHLSFQFFLPSNSVKPLLPTYTPKYCTLKSLVSLDVVGLYLQIPHEKGIENMKKTLNKRTDKRVST
jgi:hypothetical protein